MSQVAREVGYRARRWVVERTHSWLNSYRRILVRGEKRAETYLAMLHLACGLTPGATPTGDPERNRL